MKQLREQVNLSPADVASQLEISVSSINNWEAGRTMPKLRLDQFMELIRLYQCNAEDLEHAHQESQQKYLQGGPKRRGRPSKE